MKQRSELESPLKLRPCHMYMFNLGTHRTYYSCVALNFLLWSVLAFSQGQVQIKYTCRFKVPG